MEPEVPHYAGKFDPPEQREGLEVELAVPCSIAPNGRKILGALLRTPGKDPHWVEGWVATNFVADPVGLWEYFDYGSWNNGYTTEVLWLQMAREEDAPSVLSHLQTLLNESEPASLPRDVQAPESEHASAPPEPAVEDAADPNAAGQLSIVRADPPSWLTIGRPAENYDRWRELTGEQPEWGYAIPQMYRVLNSPYAGHELLRGPDRGDDTAVGCAYWSALLHLLVYSLGWIRPERGLLCWQVAGEPVDDIRLQLLAQVWRADEMLDWFHAWAYGRQMEPVIEQLLHLTGCAEDDDETPSNPNWVEDQKAIADASQIPAPCSHGGSDPLHLSQHVSAPIARPRGAVSMIRTSTSRRRAVLMLGSMVGWYRALCIEGARLPAIGDQSWRVEVVVRTVGSLGVFRRSRVSGIWFSGRHRFHTLGLTNPSFSNQDFIWHP